MSTIGAAWDTAVVRVGGDPGRDADGAGGAASAELESRYAEPRRTYHGTTHIEAVLADAAGLAAATGLDAGLRDIVVLAACAHDIVHDGGVDDERASARWATRRLRAAGIDAGIVGRVRDLVLATVDHVAHGDPAAEVLLDADLAVLGGSPAAYARYVGAVRAEYGHVTDEQWRVGRAEILRSLLALPTLYSTAPGAARWQAAARANVQAELDRL